MPNIVRRTEAERVAVIGMAGRFPDAPNTAQFWSNLMAAHDSARSFMELEVADGHVGSGQAVCIAKGSLLEHCDEFDAAFFGLSEGDACLIDPQYRVLLECAWHALEDAGYADEKSGHGTGVYVAASASTYFQHNVLGHLTQMKPTERRQAEMVNQRDFLPALISYKLDLRGPSFCVQSACSSSLLALHVATLALLDGECDLALAGGVSIPFPQRAGHCPAEGSILSKDGHCRPFDAGATGTRSAPGAGIVVLKRLEEAQRENDSIRAVILGSATGNDGSARASFSAPGADGQHRVIARAIERAGVTPESIGFIEANATGTPLGDAIETAALRRAFPNVPGAGACALGSVKGNVGHLDAAAGVASLIKAILAIENRTIPPTANYVKPNPYLGLDGSRFFVNSVPAKWDGDSGIRRAGVNCFGIGGTNVHVVLEQAPESESRPGDSPVRIVLLSAKTTEALRNMHRDLANHLSEGKDEVLDRICATLQLGRRRLPFRSFVICRDCKEAAERLAAATSTESDGSQSDTYNRPVIFALSGAAGIRPEDFAEIEQTNAAFRAGLARSALHARETDQTYSEKQASLLSIQCGMAEFLMSLGIKPCAILGTGDGSAAGSVLAGVPVPADKADASALFMNIDGVWRAEPMGGEMEDTLHGAIARVHEVLEIRSCDVIQLPSLSVLTAGIWRAAAGQSVMERAFAALGNLWVAGVSIDWRSLYGGRPPGRVSLPLYPFDRERCYMPSTATLKEVSADGAGDEAVRTPVERDLLGIWQELLPRQEISTDQSFFALGGSEETAQQMFSLIRERFGVSVEPAVLTEAPTIGELAEHIDLVKWLLTPATPTSPDHDELVL